ncbi:hypothetical protein B0H13DRAFT_1883109 [Mycena leptocephala]|nr:hypothetical protein B0H13DRAFT_1883109 [Mycena leptocephala]
MSVAVAPRYDGGWVHAFNEAIYARPACAMTSSPESQVCRQIEYLPNKFLKQVSHQFIEKATSIITEMGHEMGYVDTGDVERLTVSARVVSVCQGIFSGPQFSIQPDFGTILETQHPPVLIEGHLLFEILAMS